MVLQAGLDASWGACEFLIPNTQYGRSVHLSKCEACSTQVAGEARRDHGGNDSAFSALGGLTTQSLEVTVQSPDVAIGSLRLRAEDPNALNLLGVALRQRGDVAGGVAAIRRAVALRPDSAVFRASLGGALAEAG